MSKVFTIAEGLENLGALRTGGQGSVYKGRRTGTVLTAVKILPTPIHAESEDDKNFRNFQNEVAKLQKVNEQPNPNVVKILSSGIAESGSLPYIEMEYIEGPDLCDLLQPPHERIFTLKEVIRVADQLAGALAHCHKVGVKHGDVKSNNVKYNIHTGNYVLLDFGLAIMTEEQRRSSVRHAGAIEFMAPEQHEGHMLPQTDVYSFGVVLFEMLTGEVPFPLTGSGETARNTVVLAHMESPVPDIKIRRSAHLPADWSDEKQHQEMQVPQWLLNVIDKCLRKAPQDRYANAIELHEAITSGSLAMADAKGQEGVMGKQALQDENEHLQAMLLQAQQTVADKEKQLASLKPLVLKTGIRYNEGKGVFESDRSIVNVPKRVFMGLLVLSGLLLILCTWAFLSKPKAGPATISSADTVIDKQYKSPFIFVKQYNMDSLVKAQEKPVTPVITAAKKAAPRHPVKPKKKKRKKFLGIF